MSRCVVACSAVLVVIALSLGAAAPAGAPPELRQQAAAIKGFAVQRIGRVRPQWAAADRELWAQAFETAVLKHARGPLSEPHVADLRKAITKCADTSRKALTRSWLPFAAMVYDFIVGDIIATPLADPADVARLKAQVSQLSSYIAEQLVERLEASPQAAQSAAEQASALYADYIDQPKYRFARRPMTDEQMEAARADIREAIDEKAPMFARVTAEFPHPPGGSEEPPEFRQRRVEFITRPIAQHALHVVSHKYWSWRHMPDTGDFQEARGRAVEASRALRAARDIAGRISPMARRVVAAGLHPDPIAGCPALTLTDLPAEQAGIVRRLRGAVRPVRTVRYSAYIELLAPVPKRTPGIHHFEAQYIITPPLLRLEIRGAPDPMAPEDDRLVGATTLYEVGPDRARVSSTAGDLVGAVSAEDARGPTTVRKLLVSPWEAAKPRAELLAIAQMADPGRFEWRAVEEGAAGGETEIFEARLKQPATLYDLSDIASLRYWFDPERRAVLRAVAYDPEGAVLWETVYEDFEALPGGSAVALRATEVLSPGAVRRRHEARRQLPAWPRPLYCIGCETVTEYKWFPEAGVRLPVRREIHGEHGLRECFMEFYDHEIEANDGQ